MKRWINIIVQSLGFISQGAVIQQLPITDENKMLTHTIVGAIQGIVAIIAHSYNADGTPAKIAYVKVKKQVF